MKKIEAIIRPSKLEDIKHVLSNYKVSGMTISEVKGFGIQRGFLEQKDSVDDEPRLISKIKLEIVIPDEIVEEVIDALCEHAKTGEVGDGKLFVLDVLDSVRIRTKERGERAI